MYAHMGVMTLIVHEVKLRLKSIKQNKTQHLTILKDKNHESTVALDICAPVLQ
jgi:hypothetical protein